MANLGDRLPTTHWRRRTARRGVSLIRGRVVPACGRETLVGVHPLAIARGISGAWPKANNAPDCQLLYDLTSAARMLGCSRDHLSSLVHDGEIDFVDLARPGSRHREIRFTLAQLEAYVTKRTRRNLSAAGMTQYLAP